MKLYEYLADAFIAEGVSEVFALMGDANMMWLSAMERHESVNVVHARHEGAALTMADGYSRSTGAVGVCSVTSGPGITQLGTALTAAARHSSQVVVFAGDTPRSMPQHVQRYDPGPLVQACGARFLRADTVEEALDLTAVSFHLAASGGPVVMAIPYDVQETDEPWGMAPSTSSRFALGTNRTRPDQDRIAALAAELCDHKVVVLAGAGCVGGSCRASLLELSRLLGAPVATTLRAKGLFDGEPHNLGVAGAFSTLPAREAFAQAEVVLAFGASLGYHTTEGGYLFPAARVIQIDQRPRGLVDGQRTADVHIIADASAAADELIELLGSGVARPWFDAVIAPESADDQVAPATVPPRQAMRIIDGALPKRAQIVVGAGHFWNFVVPGLSGRRPENMQFHYDFGAISHSLPAAIGAARARPDSLTVAIEGDGSLLMNLQELETLARHRLPVLIIIMNDGAYGAEYHKLRAKGAAPDASVFGFTDFAAVSRGFGITASTVTKADELASAIAEFAQNPQPTVIDIRLDVQAASDTYKRLYYGQETVLG